MWKQTKCQPIEKCYMCMQYCYWALCYKKSFWFCFSTWRTFAFLSTDTHNYITSTLIKECWMLFFPFVQLYPYYQQYWRRIELWNHKVKLLKSSEAFEFSWSKTLSLVLMSVRMKSILTLRNLYIIPLRTSTTLSQAFRSLPTVLHSIIEANMVDNCKDLHSVFSSSSIDMIHISKIPTYVTNNLKTYFLGKDIRKQAFKT